VLGNGDYFGRHLNFTVGLAVVCAVLSIAAVVLLPRIGWRELRLRSAAESDPPGHSVRLAFVVFWSSSALLLSLAFIVSATPVDLQAGRYLVGLIFAAAAVIPVVAAGRRLWTLTAVVGTCIFALAGTISMGQGIAAQTPGGVPPDWVASRVGEVAARNHLRTGYAGYWYAAPITWANHFRVQ